MTGKDLFVALGSIPLKYYEEAESDTIADTHSRKSIRRPLLVAAVIALTLLLAGCAVVYVLSLQNMRLGEYNATIPSCEAEPSGQVISSDVVSMQGILGSPGYQAAKEWQDFLDAYDLDGALLRNADASGYQPPEDYAAYLCYTSEMEEKIDAICRKYGLEPLGPTVLAEDGYEALDALGIRTILSEDTGAVTALSQGYYYPGGTFALEGETTLSGEDSPWIYPIDFQYRCVMKNAFDTVSLAVGNVEDYRQWDYTLADGTQALLAISEEKALILVDKADYFVTVNVLNPRVGDLPLGEQRMDPAGLEGFADTFSFAYTPNKAEIPAASSAPAGEGAFSTDTPARRAFQRTLQTIHDELYWPELYFDEIHISEPGTIEDEHFAILDVDGDGEEELLVSVSNTYVAGMQEVIYAYDPQSDGVRVEFWNYVAVTHYPGMLKVDASHNHGYAGEVLWPYVTQYYDPEEDVYKDGYIVDAWCKEISEYNPYSEMAYPEEIDTEKDGYVFLITENGQQRILNRADYEVWKAEVFAQKEPLTIPWQKMTGANIGLTN